MELSQQQRAFIDAATDLVLKGINLKLNEDARNQLAAALIDAIEDAAHQPALGRRVRVTAGGRAGLIGTIVGVDESLYSRFTVSLDVDPRYISAIRLAPHELEVIA